MGLAWDSVLIGVPVVIVHLAVTTGFLIGAVGLYASLAPYRQLALIREGNAAAAIVLSGQIFALAIPLAATLANSVNVAEILLWGTVTIILQLIPVVVARLTVLEWKPRIERGEIAPAVVFITAQVVAGLLNAAALSR